MSIPIDPRFVAGAVQLTCPPNAQASNLCKIPPEGFKTLSLQFKFDQTLSWYVDPSALGLSPNSGMSQICAMFMDTSQFIEGIYVYFPDSGFAAFIAGGTTELVPIISNKALPPFYIIMGTNTPLLNFDTRSLQPPNYVFNLILMNQFVPPYSSNVTIRTQPFGFTDFFGPVPNYVMSTVEPSNLAIVNSAGNFTTTPINHPLWFFKGSDTNIVGNTTDESTAIITATFNDNGIPFLTKNILLTPQLSEYQIFDQQDLNYESSGNGPLTFQLSTGAATINANVAINTFGGILKF